MDTLELLACDKSIKNNPAKRSFWAQFFWESFLAKQKLSSILWESKDMDTGTREMQVHLSNGLLKEADDQMKRAAKYLHPKATMLLGKQKILASKKSKAAAIYGKGLLLLQISRYDLWHAGASHTATSYRLEACAVSCDTFHALMQCPCGQNGCGNDFAAKAAQMLLKSAALGDSESNYIAGYAYMGINLATDFGVVQFTNSLKVDLKEALGHFICSAESGNEKAAMILVRLLAEIFPPKSMITIVMPNSGIEDAHVISEFQPSWGMLRVKLGSGSFENCSIYDTIDLNKLVCTVRMKVIVMAAAVEFERNSKVQSASTSHFFPLVARESKQCLRVNCKCQKMNCRAMNSSDVIATALWRPDSRRYDSSAALTILMDETVQEETVQEENIEEID